MIHEGTAAEAGMAADAKQKIDALCREWAKESGEPFSLVVARNGVIVTQAAFGTLPDGTSATVAYRTEIASITKAISGILFSQFLDQGLVKADDPVGKYLPGLPTTGDKAITFRQCFTHTNGLKGHGDWGGIHNPYLDNVVLNGLKETPVGKVHLYNGMGYDLAGKAMEAITGKSIFRLFFENVYSPLGINNMPPQGDLAYGARLTAIELATLGQLLLNRGSYGDKQFISKETFETVLPTQLSKFYPGIDKEWGLGLVWTRERKAGAPPDSTRPDDLLLGMNTIGHGSATSSILRVDLDNNLVIAQVRWTAGPKFGDYERKLYTVISEAMKGGAGKK